MTRAVEENQYDLNNNTMLLSKSLPTGGCSDNNNRSRRQKEKRLSTRPPPPSRHCVRGSFIFGIYIYTNIIRLVGTVRHYYLTRVQYKSHNIMYRSIVYAKSTVRGRRFIILCESSTASDTRLCVGTSCDPAAA